MKQEKIESGRQPNYRDETLIHREYRQSRWR